MQGSSRAEEDIRKISSPVRLIVAILAGVSVLGLVLLLLSWGLSGMEWTVLTTNNDVSDAIATHKLSVEAGNYSIPVGIERSYNITLLFQVSNGGFGCGYPSCTLPAPVSNSSTTINDYVVFSESLSSSGSGAIVWYTGPQGNLTQATTLSSGTNSIFFNTETPGNYSVHILAIKCVPPLICQPSATAASGTFFTGASTITYSRPYSANGLATVIISVASIPLVVAFLGVTTYRLLKFRR